MGSWTTYPNPLIDQLTGLLQLLRGAPDGKDAYVGVSVGRRVSLKLHMGMRLLFDILDGFATWKSIRLKKNILPKKYFVGLKIPPCTDE